jgi:hypothetical protein
MFTNAADYQTNDAQEHTLAHYTAKGSNNGEVSSVNMTLDGTMYPGQKLAHFVLCKKTEVNKTHHLILPSWE